MSYSLWLWRRGSTGKCDSFINRSECCGGGELENVIDESIVLAVAEGVDWKM